MSESLIGAEDARTRRGARQRRRLRDATDAEMVFDPFLSVLVEASMTRRPGSAASGPFRQSRHRI